MYINLLSIDNFERLFRKNVLFRAYKNKKSILSRTRGYNTNTKYRKIIMN